MPGTGSLTFADVLRMQRNLQTGYADGDPVTMQNNEHRIAFMQQQYVNITKELGEALDEIGWKPWGSSRHINALPCLKELVDLQHFLNNWLLTLMPLLDCDTTDELAELYLSEYQKKNQINWERQAGNYNGFAEKCEACGREREQAVWKYDPERGFNVLTCICNNVIEVDEVMEEDDDD